jgi:hypothetical protein
LIRSARWGIFIFESAAEKAYDYADGFGKMDTTDIIEESQKAELLSVAANVFWWGTPEKALENTPRFLAQVMTFGDWRDVQTTMKLLGKDAFQKVLENPPTGVFDIKSWNYWHLFFHKQPVPPLPSRVL